MNIPIGVTHYQHMPKYPYKTSVTFINDFSEFHSMGPATAKARLPNVSRWNFGTIRTHALFDLREYLELVHFWSMLVM